MSSTLSKDGTAVSEPVTRGRHAAPKPRGRFRSLGAMPGTLVTTIARSITAPAEAEVSNRDIARRARPAPDPAPAADTIDVLIADGESLADLAARYGVSTASLIALNGLSWRTALTAGDVLRVRPALPPEAPDAPAVARTHRVEAGETVAGIAARHGVAPAALLLANGLSRTSAVSAGQHLVIPGPAVRRPSGPIVLTGDMRRNAGTLVAAGRELGVPDDGIVVALAVAMQVSCLHNLDFGEDDAVGIFQQRPSDGWGTESELLDVRHAALAFFAGPAHPAPRAVGLLDVPGWQLRAIGEAAVAVQPAASAAAYGKWERCARTWLEDLEQPARG